MKTTLVCVLDGFGLNPKKEGNAVAMAKKPCIDRLLATYPNTTLVTHGERVGLPAGQMGNSEVGHLNIGAGRVVEQWLLRISRALSGEFLEKSRAWKDFINNTKSSPTIHIAGLYSTGGVHSHAEHLKLLIKRLSLQYNGQILLHLFTDGRDTSPHSAKDDVSELMAYLKQFKNCKIASLCGRFYAMDRDKRWERVQKSWNAIALNKGEAMQDPLAWIEKSYTAGVTDEFIEPAVFTKSQLNINDGFIFFNFREDRMREIVSALATSDFSGFARDGNLPKQANVLCFTEYDHTHHLPFLFEPLDIKNHLGEVVAQAGLKQIRLAETEKYPHVTYFFNGGVEKPYNGEERCMVPSPRDVKTYDQKPEMSALGVTEKVIESIRSKNYSLVVVNLANCDMVGHTGVIPAAIKAVETVDQCLASMLSALDAVGGQAVIFADHGNAEQMINYEDGTPMTSHTTFPVPCIVYGAGKLKLRDGGALCDIAPTVLKLMEISVPTEMTGTSLF